MSAIRIAVIGASGVLGRHVVPRLVEAGHAVRISYRNEATAARFAHLNADAMQADLFDGNSLSRLVDGVDAVLHLATAIPKGGGTDWSLNDRIRREGTVNLLAACQRGGVGRYVQQSIAMILCADDSRPQTEADPVRGDGVLASALDMEAAVRAADLDWRIVRGGAFYGPGTGREEAWRAAAGAGSLEVPGDGSAYVSLIHVADMAAAVAACLDADAPRTIWNAVDDLPVTTAVLMTGIAARYGGARRRADRAAILSRLECAPQIDDDVDAALPELAVRSRWLKVCRSSTRLLSRRN